HRAVCPDGSAGRQGAGGGEGPEEGQAPAPDHRPGRGRSANDRQRRRPVVYGGGAGREGGLRGGEPARARFRQGAGLARNDPLRDRRRAREHGGRAVPRREAGLQGEMMGIFSSLFGKKEPEPARPQAEEEEENPAEWLDSPDGAARVDAVSSLI